MAASVNDIFIDRKSSTTVITIPVPTLQQQEEYRLQNSSQFLANATPGWSSFLIMMKLFSRRAGCIKKIYK